MEVKKGSLFYTHKKTKQLHSRWKVNKKGSSVRLKIFRCVVIIIIESKDKYMDTNTYNHIKKEITRYIPKQYCDEVLQDVLVGIYQREVLPSDIVSYTIRACYRNFFSSNSTFARQKFTYEPLTDDINPPDDGDEVVDIDKVISWVNDIEVLSWWEKQCFLRKILENKTFKELSKEYRVSEKQITYSFYKAKKIIQAQWQKRNQEV